MGVEAARGAWPKTVVTFRYMFLPGSIFWVRQRTVDDHCPMVY
jgi:hypothetical protein